MVAATPPACDFGWKAADFALPATDGSIVTLDAALGRNGLLIMFICNHCPYVVSVLDRLIADARAVQALEIGVVAICANDADNYPADSFDNMVTFAKRGGFTFPYLHDENQSVARAYGAACTPDFFGFNHELELQYRGRLDDAGRGAADRSTKRELYDAMRRIAETGTGPTAQIPSMGCSIKWKSAA
ncbi:MAG: thioredoxin family protein [Rhodobacteraceae bacterium]|nr:thioredoxin family protein [Paracoccaceae bacterium]